MNKLSAGLLIMLVLACPGLAATYTVINTNDSGAGSLRQAIDDANVNPGADTIDFDIPNADPGYITEGSISYWRIQPLSGLPTLSDNDGVLIDGSTQTTNRGNTNPSGPEIMLDGSSAGDARGFVTSGNPGNGNDNIIKGLIIGNFTDIGIDLESSNNQVVNCYIGTNASGQAAAGNANGIRCFTGNANTIEGNIISGSFGGGSAVKGYGLWITVSSNNTIKGNYFGVNATGTAPITNEAISIFIQGPAESNVIGGDTAAERNIISGAGVGIMFHGANVANNTVKGNYIGTDASGTAAIPNDRGIFDSGTANIIGPNNVISGNTTNGIWVVNGTSCEVKGNYIGTDKNGTAALANGNGVFIQGIDCVIKDNNIISGNTGSGITLSAAGIVSNHTMITGNYIGLDATGATALPNQQGINITGNSDYNTIGGSTAGARNIISGNSAEAVSIDSGSYNQVKGNYIGTDVTGLIAIGNQHGVGIGSAFNTVEGNVVSGNSVANIIISGSSNEVKGNYIGLAADGNTALPSVAGIYMVVAAPEQIHHNIIGGSTAGEKNIISATTGWPSSISLCGSYNQIKGNYIGTNASGTAALGNTNGINIFGGCYNTIGGQNVGDRNIIAGSVGFWNADSLGFHTFANSNEVTNNYFGLDPSGTIPLGTNFPVWITGEAQYNKISSNTFAYFGTGTYSPGGSGLNVIAMFNEAAKYNTITKNLFINNIVPEMITLYNGANNNVSSPVIQSINSDGLTNSTITGTAPVSSIIEVFQAVPPSTEAQAFLGSVEADVSGNWSFLASGTFSSSEITATATDRSGNTSQFSVYSAASTTTTITSTTTSVTTTTTSTTTTTTNGFGGIQIEATPAIINLEFNVPTADSATFVIVDPGPPPRVVKEMSFSNLTAGQNLLTINTLANSGAKIPRGVYDWKLIYKGQVRSGSIIIP